MLLFICFKFEKQMQPIFFYVILMLVKMDLSERYTFAGSNALGNVSPRQCPVR